MKTAIKTTMACVLSVFTTGSVVAETPVDTRLDIGYGYSKTTFYDGEGFYADYRYQILRDVVLTAHYSKVKDDNLRADGTRYGLGIEKTWVYNEYTDIGIAVSYTHDKLEGNGYDQSTGIWGVGVGYHSFVGDWRFDGAISVKEADVEDTYIEGDFRATYFFAQDVGLTLSIIGGDLQNVARVGLTYTF